VTAPSIALADVTLFRPRDGVEVAVAAPAPREFPARTSDMLGICVKLGAAHEVLTDGRRVTYPADAVCVRPAGTVWASRTPPVGFVSIDVAPEVVPEAAAAGRMAFLPRRAAPDVVRAARRLAVSPSPHERDEIVVELLDAVAARGALRIDAAGDAPAAVARARELLHAAVSAAPSLDAVAALSGANKFVLVRGFRRALGTTPHAYLVALRVDRARALLARGVPPAEAAAATGFADQSHLGRHFKRALGLTPAEYARRTRAVKIVPDGVPRAP
jgi:AraC-like DNA-binding protein